ncbi:MAG: FeoA family protein [Promethearchaeota archaeon]
MLETTPKPSHPTEIPLADLPLNHEGTVTHISAGHRATQRLSGMGIIPGTKIQIISQAPFRGPLQISIRGTRLAIGRGLAYKIMVHK